jgi:serine/threonine protein kinase
VVQRNGPVRPRGRLTFGTAAGIFSGATHVRLIRAVRAALAQKGYDLLRELASGGMGTVFLARQVTLDRLVAVKVLRPALATAEPGPCGDPEQPGYGQRDRVADPVPPRSGPVVGRLGCGKLLGPQSFQRQLP